MATRRDVLLLSISALLNVFSIALAFDPFPLQDFCVADLASTGRVNGLPCKDPASVTADDFYSSGLDVPGNLSSPLGFTVKTVSVLQIPGLNTLGLTMVRLDFAANGSFPPHYHSRATEALIVLEGSVEAGFVSSGNSNVLFSKMLNKGDVFVVPVGLIHYARNLGSSPASTLAFFNSQNFGVGIPTTTLFGAKPAIDTGYLASAFQLDRKIIEDLQKTFSG